VTAILEVRGVRKTFGGVVANHDVTLVVPAGKIYGLIGPNGSGKTTLFNSIAGLHPIDAGSIRFKGREISELRVPEIARLGLLRTFQQTRTYVRMTCVQNMLISVPASDLGWRSLFRKSTPAERLEADMPFADMLVAIDARVKGLHRVVDMEGREHLQPDILIELREGALIAFVTAQIVTGRERMLGIEA